MRGYLAFALMGLLAAMPLAAQEPEAEPGRAAELRQAIETRFTARVKEELGLTDQQAEKLGGVAREQFRLRRELEAEERRLRAQLASELRPGVAGNPDRVARLTDQLLDLKVRYAQTYREEARELSGFLDPIQRAQYFVLRERLLERIREAQERRDARVPPLRRGQP